MQQLAFMLMEDATIIIYVNGGCYNQSYKHPACANGVYFFS